MKRFILLVMAVLAIGCQKLPEDKLLGVWRLDRVESRFNDGTLYPVPGPAGFSSITFKKGGIGYIDSEPIEYRINGETLAIIGTKETNLYHIEVSTRTELQLSFDVLHTDLRKFYFMSRFE